MIQNLLADVFAPRQPRRYIGKHRRRARQFQLRQRPPLRPRTLPRRP